MAMPELLLPCGLRLLASLLLCFLPVAHPLAVQTPTSIVVSSTGHSHFQFDIFACSFPTANSSSLIASGLDPPGSRTELRLTDGASLNYNGQFVANSDIEYIETELGVKGRSGDILLAYVSERDGSPQIYFDVLDSIKTRDSRKEVRTTGKLKRTDLFQDRPSVRRGRAIFAGVRDPNPSNDPSSTEVHRVSWTAVYSTNVSSGETACLSPEGVADFSPSVSPSGEWVIVASDQGKGFNGELCGIHSDLYIFKSTDASQRRLLVKDGGWPSWCSETRFFFHRRDAEDRWWSVYEANLDRDPLGLPEDGLPQEQVKRISPPGLHAFTPAASRTGKWLAVATRRPGTRFRHIEIVDLATRKFIELTASIAPRTHHYNPFVSDDLNMVGYHRCRFAAVTAPFDDFTDSADRGETRKHLHALRSPLPGVSLFRIDGDFPSFSPDGSMIAFNPSVNSPIASHVDVMNLDGTNRRRIFEGSKEGSTRKAFGTAWDRKESGVVYTAVGEDIFMVATAPVHLCKLRVGGNTSSTCKISRDGRLSVQGEMPNNAFPSPSPDGRELVFRSSHDGTFFFNLYIMHLDAADSRHQHIRRLTEGEWTDTMCNWSPDGEWIAFASDREKPGAGSYSTYMIRPDGSGLRRVASRNALHPQFSPDSRSIAVTTDYAGLSAEPISMPNEFQPYGEVYVVRITKETELSRAEDAEFENGKKLLETELVRLTFGPYETGLGAWGSQYIDPETLPEADDDDDVAEEEERHCSFHDVLWLDSKLRQCQFCNHALLIERTRTPSSSSSSSALS